MTAVRPSAVAGAWYPGAAPALLRTVTDYLDAAPPAALPGPLMALVCPHAGYRYSGPTAAHAYAQLRSDRTTLPTFRRVVLLGPLHRLIPGSALGSFMIPAEDVYRTPLGDTPVDRIFLSTLGVSVPLTTVRHDEEHSLEIQLPFLQATLDEFSLVPILLGESLEEPGVQGRLDAFASALAEAVTGDTLLVASTDLSHLDNYADVVRIDRRLVDLMDAFDVSGVARALAAGTAQACGGAGLYVVLRACQLRGAQGARVLSYAASGDVTGDKRPGVYTVGYMAAAVHG